MTTLHARFTQQARRTPHATALTFEDEAVTYAALDRWSSQLAQALVSRGVRRGDLVALCAERGLPLVASILAILKCGAAYVPLDPHYPADRLAYVLTDACATTVLAERATAAALPAGAHTTLLVDDDSWWRDAPAEAPHVSGEPDDLAYVIYTSGSTGKPKGVMVTHHNVLRLFAQTDAWFAFDARDVWTLFHSFAFDFSVWELWGALLYGGRLVVVPYATSRSPDAFRDLLARERVTVLNQTPSAFHPLADAILARQSASLDLRLVIFGGEALEPRLLRPWLTRFGDARPRLVNMYGITETTVHVTYRPITAADVAGGSVIGEPIPDLALHLLDEHLQPVPLGTTGEIFVSGDGVARGYLNRPTLTAERFLRNPFGPGRLYRSGDLARRLPNGDLEYLGRGDAQVKLRGFRVELGEIEACLTEQPSVARAVVAVRGGPHDLEGGAEPRLVAYVVLQASESLDASALRAAAQRALPPHMVPDAFVAIDAIPLTENGKADRRALPAPPAVRPRALAAPFVAPSSDAERQMAAAWCDVLGVDAVGALDSFFDLGGTSRLALQLTARLAERGVEVPVTRLYERPTLRAFVRSSRAERGISLLGPEPEQRGPSLTFGAAEGIAIVGMAVRFPGADDVDQFWTNLRDSVESISHFTADELATAGLTEVARDPAYVPARGVLRDVDQFDAPFFGMTPREAQLTDPQQRLLLELAWTALEHSGHVPESFGGRVGVFAGVHVNDYARVLERNPELVAQYGAFNATLLNEKDYVATRVAHRLDLTGPALSIHTACSTALVNVVQAVQSLRAGACDLALAGGASLTLPTTSGHRYQEGAMRSPDGRTRPFDASAAGTVFSDGAGLVVLKRLTDAERDGDTIHAVIRGVGVTNDGARKASFTAPSVDGQAAAIAVAHRDAGVTPREISYVEAHGTATPLGDPIEVEALTRVFRADTADVAFCGLGSVKSNIGHTVVAAGAAGLVKTTLALARESIPATLHHSAPNPLLDLATSPFAVVATPTAWPRAATPRLAGVSSFGIGGTNAHVVVGEAPPDRRTAVASERAEQLLVLSARTSKALDTMRASLAATLARDDAPALADVARTLAVGRRRFAHRCAVVARTPADAAQALGTAAHRAASLGTAAEPPRVAFLFPGQGAQYLRMGRALYDAEPAFRDAFDRCAAVARSATGVDLRAAIDDGDDDALSQTALAQPALFATEYALAALVTSWGVAPAAMTGHSVGEFVAATIAGVFALDDAVRLIAERGRLMQALPPGAMLSVRLPAADVRARLAASGASDLDVASENAPSLCVVAGSSDAVRQLQQTLEADGVACRPLRTSHAFHSAMMDPAVDAFAELLRDVPLAAPRTPIASTVTGDWLTDDEARDPRYWARHLRATVRFDAGVRTLWRLPHVALLELGPRGTLATLARQQRPADDALCVAALGESGDPAAERAALLGAVGRLWTRGAEPDWTALAGADRGGRVPLPTYPFDRQRHWTADAKSPTVDAAPPLTLVRTLPVAMPQPTASPVRLVADLRALLERVSGAPVPTPDARFVELGFDSLVLTQVALALSKQYGRKITFRQLLEELDSVRALAAYLADAAPTEPSTLSVPSVPPAAVAAPVAVANDAVERLVQQQLQLMAQQLEMLKAVAPTVTIAPTVAATPTVAPVPTVDEQLPSVGPDRAVYDATKAFGAAPRITVTRGGELTPLQRARLDAFVRRYTARTAGSKRFTSEHRGAMADPRATTGFRPTTKELVYPIVVERSQGPRLWDVDGNEYVDVLSGFGSNLFGWSPPFVVDAVKRQLDRGYEVGPQSPLAGEVARLVCEVTGHERAAFCSTGSEAVLGAVRIARTVTGRRLVVTFAGSYHGINDESIVRAGHAGSSRGAVPAAPGILDDATSNVLVLEYGADASLQLIAERADEIAAVLVEPVQSRRPDLQPAQFLRALRELTTRRGIVCVWDEIVTGFRAAPGGAQEHFGIRADLATYGKVVGGGLPIGVIAGRRDLLDALDGGAWQYGDASVPEVGVTYFAGTFVRHPLALAAARAVLLHLQREGPSLQRALNDRTAAMAASLNAGFQSLGAPLEVRAFSSLWKTFVTGDAGAHTDLLYYALRDRGVHLYDGFPCFLTSAHGEAEVAHVVEAFDEAVRELQDADFLPARRAATVAADKPPVPGARLGRDRDGSPAWFTTDPHSGRHVKVGAA